MREGSQNSSAGTLSARYRNPSERPKMQERLKNNDGNVFGRLGHRRQSAFEQLSDTYSPSTTMSGPDRANSRDRSHSRGRPHRRDSSSRDRPRSRDRSRGVEESYGNTCSSYGTGDRHGYHSRDRDRSRSMKRGRVSESPLSRVSESGTSDGGHWKSTSKRHKPTNEEDLAVPKLLYVESLPRMLPSPRKACHVCLALPGRASTGLGLVLAHHSLFVWLGLGPIVIIRFRARGLLVCGLRGLVVAFRVLTDLTVQSTCPTVIMIFTFDPNHWLGGHGHVITDIKSVLSQKSLDMFCQNFHIPNEVHPQLPSPNQTIHEMPTGKIGVYTRFFEYANFRLPLSTFLVNVLKHYRIHISQLSVIGAAKVSHFEILCRVHGFEPTVGLFCCFYVNSKNKGWMSFSKRQDYDAVCYTKPLDSLKGWNDHFFWVDAFACPASFSWQSSKNVPNDPFPKSSEFNADHYATLVAYPAPFHKYPEPFLCLVGMSHNYTLDENTYPEFLRDNDEEMDLLSFIRTADPTKLRIGERQSAEDEPKLLDTTVGRVVPLLPIAPARAESELEASVEKLFDEGGSGNQVEQGDFASDGGGQGINIRPVTEITDTVAETVISLQPRRPKKRKNIAADAGGPSHPPKKLREDHGTPSGASQDFFFG
ncbi:hypothetical protein Tco_0967683 [Tanacetum coccineum]